MRIDGGAVRMGMVVEYEGKLKLVVKHEIRTPGNLRSFNQVELKDIQNGTKQNIRLASDEKIERVSLDQSPFNFLFAEDENLTFMNNESYEQITMPKSLLGDALPFLQDGMTVMIETYDGTPINVTLPTKVTLEIVDTEPAVKGQTAASSYKPAMLSNGVRINVPPFVSAGEKVVVDTVNLTYIERAKA